MLCRMNRSCHRCCVYGELRVREHGAPLLSARILPGEGCQYSIEGPENDLFNIAQTKSVGSGMMSSR
jgi:hypothetical protein